MALGAATRTEAAGCIRELIEEIRLVPEKGRLRIELFGELAALINLAGGRPRGKGAQVTLVAGALLHTRARRIVFSKGLRLSEAGERVFLRFQPYVRARPGQPHSVSARPASSGGIYQAGESGIGRARAARSC
jgi:hypothetical protein